MLDVPGIEVLWLTVTSYESIVSCGLQWKPLNGGIDEQEVSGDDDAPYTNPLELLVQCHVVWAQVNSAVDLCVTSAWVILEPALTYVQRRVPITIKKVLDLSR